VTGVDGQSRASDDFPDRPLQIRYDQKMAKYGHIVDQSRFQFVPTIFSHTGQIHGAFKSLLGEQIRQNLVAFEGQAKPSKIKSVMKWWSKCISMVIAKTASRNVAFKAAKIADSAFAGQSEILTREVARDDVPNDEQALDDLGRNADLYILHQDVADSQQVNDVRTWCQPAVSTG